jgi:flagellar basal body-associated protein FliL
MDMRAAKAGGSAAPLVIAREEPAMHISNISISGLGILILVVLVVLVVAFVGLIIWLVQHSGHRS